MDEHESINAQNRASIRFEMFTGDTPAHHFYQKRNAGISLRRTEERRSLIMMKRSERAAHQSSSMDESIHFDSTNLHIVVAGIASIHTTDQYENCRIIRSWLDDDNPPIQELVESGAVSHLLGLLNRTDGFTVLLSETLTCLCIIAGSSPENADAIAQENGVGIITPFIRFPDSELSDTAVQTLANLAGNSHNARVQMHQDGIIEQLLCILRQEIPLTKVRAIVCLISNIFMTVRSRQDVMAALSAFTYFLSSNDSPTIRYTLNGLYHVCLETDHLAEILPFNFVPSVINFLGYSSALFVSLALDVLLSISLGSVECAEILLNEGILHSIVPVIQSDHTSNLRVACCILVNLSSNTPLHTNIIAHSGIVVPMLELLRPSQCRVVSSTVTREVVFFFAHCLNSSFSTSLAVLTANCPLHRAVRTISGNSAPSFQQYHIPEYCDGKSFGQCLVEGLVRELHGGLASKDASVTYSCLLALYKFAEFDQTQFLDSVRSDAPDSSIPESQIQLPVRQWLSEENAREILQQIPLDRATTMYLTALSSYFDGQLFEGVVSLTDEEELQYEIDIENEMKDIFGDDAIG
ncbi:hypothetical protein BLNAU_7549 [Blattamonas nauphoetae]|uniref:Importin subunit alpha n=1 Tax=Blattamonas nauphoetae TaxID=2049346 RepID=A0ABQ9Y0X6_9EUKA|nr:hypothetical protein BLNAU_7549 [Blattamonas nauphoetae]